MPLMRLGLLLAACALAADAAVLVATHALTGGMVVIGLLVLAWALSLVAFFMLIASGGAGGVGGGGGSDGPPEPGEPPWWPEFERELRDYVERRRQRPPRAPALTR
jgi:hypothetical protein